MSFTKIDHYEKEYVDHHHDSALSVTEGVADQPIVNPYFVRKKKHRLSTEEYVKGILEGNITTLSQAITLIESSNPDHYAQAQEIIERCLPHAGRSVRIGITGVPGAGLEEVWKGVEEFLDHTQGNGFFRDNRNRQNKYWMYETIDETLKNSFYRDPRIEAEISVLEGQVLDDKISSFIAAKRLLDLYFGGKAE